MKKTATLALMTATALTLVGCFSYQSRTPTRTVVVTDAPVVRESVVTTLPTGYRTRVYRGTTYYYTNDVVYRTHPRGYVVTTRPW